MISASTTASLTVGSALSSEPQPSISSSTRAGLNNRIISHPVRNEFTLYKDVSRRLVLRQPACRDNHDPLPEALFVACCSGVQYPCTQAAAVSRADIE